MRKKLIIVLMAGMLVISLFGCAAENRGNDKTTVKTGNSKEKEDKESDAATDEVKEIKEPKEKLYKIGKKAKLKEWSIKIMDFKVINEVGGSYMKFTPDEEGHKFAQIYVTVKNEGKKADNFLPYAGFGDDVIVKMLYGDGFEFGATNLLGYDSNLYNTYVNPLSSQKGELFFEIPPEVADAKDQIVLQFISGDDTVKFKLR